MEDMDIIDHVAAAPGPLASALGLLAAALGPESIVTQSDLIVFIHFGLNLT